jgi:putative oxidoreductase
MTSIALPTATAPSNSQGIVLVVARILLAAMFIGAGISKFGSLEGTAGYIASGGLPMASLLAPAVAAFELLAGIALVIGWQARWAALALALFTLVANVLFHAFWAMPAAQQFVQQLMFMKNLAVAGGLLVVFVFGAGPLALDARRISAR